MNATVMAAEWELESHKNGIKVYSKDIPNSNLVAFKGVKTMSIPISKLAELVMDRDNERKKRWIDMIIDFKVLQSRDRGFVFYSSYDLPWPASDRDFVIDCQMEVDKDKKFVNFVLKSIALAEAPTTIGVRANLILSSYSLQAINTKETLVTAEIQADPKGLLPAFVVNFIQKDWPTNTLTAMEKEASRQDLSRNPIVLKEIGY